MNTLHKDQGPLLLREVDSQNLQGVQAALESGAFVETVGSSEEGTAMNMAAKLGNVEIIKVLLKHCANIHTPNAVGYSPVHQAILHNHLEVARMLLDIGADFTTTLPQNCPIGAGKLPFEVVGACVHQPPNQELLNLLKKDDEVMEQPYHADGPKIVLVLRDSSRACVFEHALDWINNPGKSYPMTLTHYPDHGLVCKQGKHTHYGPWAVKRVGVGPIDKVMHVHVNEKWIERTLDGNWFDVEHWRFQVDNGINMLYNTDGDRPTPGGQDFVVNADGTISPDRAKWLCLGLEQPKLVLVPKESNRALHFAHKPEGLFPLTFSGAFANLGLINLWEGARQAGEWKYTHIGIGSAEDAVFARKQENFMRRKEDGFALDVEHCNFKEGTQVLWVGGKTEDRTLLRGGGRDFIPDPRAAKGLPYMLICGGAQHLVLGASTDLRLFGHLTSESQRMEVTIISGTERKPLAVNKNMTLKELRSQVKIKTLQPGEEHMDFKIELNPDIKSS